VDSSHLQRWFLSKRHLIPSQVRQLRLLTFNSQKNSNLQRVSGILREIGPWLTRIVHKHPTYLMMIGQTMVEEGGKAYTAMYLKNRIIEEFDVPKENEHAIYQRVKHALEQGTQEDKLAISRNTRAGKNSKVSSPVYLDQVY